MVAQAPKKSSTPSASGVLQRKCDKCRERDKLLQRSAVGSVPETVPPIVHEVLRSPGQPLDPATRGFMEPRFENDFSRVRIHTDAKAADSARAVNALAYTVGQNVVFGVGQYAPKTKEGQVLLAHELIHVLQTGNVISLKRTFSHVVSQPTDPAELEADQIADAVTSSQFKPKMHVFSLMPGISRKRGVRPGSDVKHARERETVETWETALTVINAIIDIINEYVYEREGMAYPKNAPQHHKEVPSRYAPLLMEWFKITRGAMLQSHIDRAMEKTKPLIEILIREGDAATAKWLAEEFYSRVNQFKHQAVETEVSESIESAATAARAKLPSIEEMTEEEKISLGIAEVLSTIRLINTSVNRYLGEATGDLAKRAKIDLLFRKITAEALKAGEIPRTDVLQGVLKMDLPTALLFLKGGLDTANAILLVANPKKRADLFAKHKNIFGKVAQGADILTVLGQFLHGSAVVTGAATYAISSLMGKASIATQVLAKGIPALKEIAFVLNAIGVAHGFAVLLDSEARGEQKAKAIFEIAVSGAGVAARFLKGFASGPATLSVVVSFYTIKAVLEKGAEGYVDLMRLGLTICFADMRETAKYVVATSTRLAIATEMELYETNPEKKKELNRQASALRWNLVDFFLRPYLKRATVSYGASNKDPAAYGPTLIDRFKPLAERKMDTDEQSLQVAAEFIQVVAKCFAEPDKILNEAATWAWKRR